MLKNMKITNKIIGAFVIMILFCVTIGLFSLLNLQTVAKTTQDMYNNQYMRRDKIADLQRGLLAVKTNLLAGALTNDAAENNDLMEDIKVQLEKVENATEFLGQSYTATNDTELLAKVNTIIELRNKLADSRIRIQEGIVQNKNEEAYKILHDEYNPKLVEIEGIAREIQLKEIATAERFVKEADDIKTNVVIYLLVIFAASLIVAIAIGLSVVNGIRIPLKEVITATDLVSRGDLNATLTYASKNEFGQISDAVRAIVKTMKTYVVNIAQVLNRMSEGDMTVTVDLDYIGDFAQIKSSIVEIAASLNSILLQIDNSSEQVASGAEQVASASQALSQGTTEQASSIEELSATIEDISVEVKKNADNAKSAEEIASSSANRVEIANEQMAEMVNAMEEINETSTKISKIIKTIDDIAFQTNILALNAAVEAARAGGAGRGFAVVADEVRNLASKSAEAAKETTVLIENSILAVQKGTKIADGTAQSLKSIVDDSKRSAGLVSMISQASTVQSQSIAQVTQGIGQISSVVQTNSATAEESAAASEELSGQAVLLTQLVGKFKLRAEGDRPIRVNKAEVQKADGKNQLASKY